MKALLYLNKYLYKYKGLLFLGLIFVVISNIFAILPAQIIRHSIDLVTSSIDLHHTFEGSALQSTVKGIFGRNIMFYCLLILVTALLRGVFLFFVRQTIIVMSRLIEFDLKNEIYVQYQALPLAFYRKNNTGDLMARISEDVSKVRMYLGPAIMYGMNLLVLFSLVIGYMLTVNVELTLYAILPLPLLSVSIYYVNNLIEKKSTEIQRSLSGLSTYVQEALSGIRVIKAFVREADSGKRFEEAGEEYRQKSLELSKVNAFFFPIVLALIGISTLLTVYAGGKMVIEGAITVGTIAEFVIYVNLLTWPVATLGWTSSLVKRAEASQKRINEFLEQKNDVVSTKNLTPEHVKGHIRFENVSFTYPDTGIKALQNVTFEILPGEAMAFLGSTGAGKSTVAALMSRLYDPTSGKIMLDGIDLKDYNPRFLRNRFGIVPQDVFLFSDSIRNNIAFGLDNAGEEEIITAAKNADLYENVIRFPKGFDTLLGERGITLSGGQKQRLSIARALIKKPQIMLLDDSLSAVDTNTENAILSNLKKIMTDRTTVIISHRVSSAKLADRITVLAGGAIAECGTHEELMATGGIYRELHDKQLTEAVVE